MSIELNQIDHREFQLGQINIKEYDINADRIIRLPLERPSLEKTVIPTKERQEVLKETGYELTKVIVEPIPDNFIEPSGTLDVVDNGNYDVKQYSNVAVNVGGESKLAKLVSGQSVEITESDLEGATSIKDYAFYRSNIASITIPNGVQSIGVAAFYRCFNLKSAIIPNSVTTIAQQSFQESTLVNLIIPDSVTTIGYNSFQNCKDLISVKLSENLTGLTNNIFNSCSSLKEIEIPSSVKTFGSYLFNYCTSLEKVVFKGQAPNITQGAFENCTKVTLYDLRNCTKMPTLYNVKSLGHSVGCKIAIPDSLYDTAIIANVWKDITDIVWVKASEYVEE